VGFKPRATELKSSALNHSAMLQKYGKIFNKAIITLTLVRYEMMITKSGGANGVVDYLLPHI